MKKWLLLSAWLVIANVAFAVNLAHIQKSPNAAVHMQPQKNSTVLERLNVGTEVTILQTDQKKGFSLIRTQSGNEGWVVLSSLSRIGDNISDTAQDTVSNVTEKIKTFSHHVGDIASVVPGHVHSANPSVQTVLLLKQQLSLLKVQNRRLAVIAERQWFFAGAGVLLLGIILGYMIARSGRRKTDW